MELEKRLTHDGYRSKITGFIDDLSELWAKAGHESRITRNAPLGEDLELPSITFRVTGREIDKSFLDVKPRHRDTVEHPYEPGHYVELYGQMFSVYVDFDFFAGSNTEADELMDTFEEFVQMYKGTLLSRGVQDFRFISQEEDSLLNERRMQIAMRRLSYVVRLEVLTPKVLNDIQQVGISTSVRNI